jgi:hypothetical protein
MSNIHTLQLSVRLNELERQIKDAKVAEFEKLPTEQNLATRKIIEYAKPMQLLGDEMCSVNPPLPEHPEPSTDEFKASFREVLRLAKSGQQAWWTNRLKESTNAHIECMDEYYRKNYNDEKID